MPGGPRRGAGAATHAPQIVQTGPPPEIRALIDGFIEAVNGDDAAWEAYAQARDASAYLQAQAPEARALPCIGRCRSLRHRGARAGAA